MTMNEFRRLAKKMDQHMQLLAAGGITDAKVIIDRMIGYIPDLHKIWVEASDDQLMALTDEFSGFYRYAVIMEDAFEAERSKPSRPYDDLAPFSEDNKSQLMGLLETAATLERSFQSARGHGRHPGSFAELENLYQQWLCNVEAFKKTLGALHVDPRAIGYVNEAFAQVEARLKTFAT